MRIASVDMFGSVRGVNAFQTIMHRENNDERHIAPGNILAQHLFRAGSSKT